MYKFNNNLPSKACINEDQVNCNFKNKRAYQRITAAQNGTSHYQYLFISSHVAVINSIFANPCMGIVLIKVRIEISYICMQ